MLVLRNPVAEKEGVAGYEIALNYNGVAFALMPRAASEIKSARKISIALRQRSRGEGRIRAGISSSNAAAAGNWQTRACANWNCWCIERNGSQGRGFGSADVWHREDSLNEPAAGTAALPGLPESDVGSFFVCLFVKGIILKFKWQIETAGVVCSTISQNACRRKKDPVAAVVSQSQRCVHPHRACWSSSPSLPFWRRCCCRLFPGPKSRPKILLA